MQYLGFNIRAVGHYYIGSIGSLETIRFIHQDGTIGPCITKKNGKYVNEFPSIEAVKDAINLYYTNNPQRLKNVEYGEFHIGYSGLREYYCGYLNTEENHCILNNYTTGNELTLINNKYANKFQTLGELINAIDEYERRQNIAFKIPEENWMQPAKKPAKRLEKCGKYYKIIGKNGVLDSHSNYQMASCFEVTVAINRYQTNRYDLLRNDKSGAYKFSDFSGVIENIDKLDKNVESQPKTESTKQKTHGIGSILVDILIVGGVASAWWMA